MNAPAIENKGPWSETVLLDLSFNRWGLTRKVASAEVDVAEAGTGTAVPPQALRVSKRLLASPEYDAIASGDGECRRRVCDFALPFRRGLHAIPVKLVDRVVKVLQEREEQRSAEVDAFVGAYAQAVERAKLDLGPLFREDDYPSAEDVRAAFGVRWTFVELGVPGRLRSISAALYESEQRKVQEQWQEASATMQSAMREAFAALIASLRERLDGDREDGKAKIFRDSRVASLQDWLGLFSDRNVAGDEALAGMVKQAQDLLSGVSADTLRRRGDMRAEVATGLKAIEASCATLGIADQPRRKFRLTDD